VAALVPDRRRSTRNPHPCPVGQPSFGQCWQVFGNGVGERDLFALDHVGEEQGSEDLRNGANFEDGVAVHLAGVVLGERAMGDDGAAFGGEDADHDADALMEVVDSLVDDLLNFGGRGHLGECRGGGGK